MSTPESAGPCANIISLKTNGAAALTCGSSSALHHVAIFREVDAVLEHQHVRVHAQHLLPERLLKSAGHRQTTTSAATPRMTPIIDTVVNTEKKLRSRQTMKTDRPPAASGSPVTADGEGEERPRAPPRPGTPAR